MSVSASRANHVKSLAYDLVSKSAQVNGIGLARIHGSFAVKVNLRDAPPQGLPKKIQGVPIVYEEVGEISQLDW
ncbi:hypothetical protein [Luteibacter sp. 3190]|uniref:hypothetical protein n=1 Tax=Luteibacter sp. 3190 TaxID=2817736 RepID=UPI0028620545|nr:hypothetical protein [Luteibacter sp. 3190]MDR6935358.1 hypothetical protein [Luteibacter sp. 3190]